MKKKYFGTDGIRGCVGQSVINAEFMLKLGWAIGKVLGSHGPSKVLIGKDTRISGYMLESALEAGLSAAGVDIHLLGPMPTPAIAYLTRTLGANAGIMISASHNLYDDNGIKFFGADGGKLGDDIELAIEAQIQKTMDTVPSSDLGKARRIVDAPGRYIEFCKSTLARQVNFRGLTFVIDCAHGATYHIAPHVFHELGAQVIELAVEPNGLNINEQCGSTCPAQLQRTVLAVKADLGIAFDGDGDRVIMVDGQGTVVDGDELLYILAMSYQRQGLSVKGVVGTMMSNFGLQIALQQVGISFERVRVGDRYVLEKLLATGWLLGGETSGHLICRDKTMTGDAIIAALQVLEAMVVQQQTLTELKRGFTKFPQVLHNILLGDTMTCPLDSSKVQQSIKEAESQLANKGRVVLRRSGTEPVVRVMVEGEDKQLVELLAGKLAEAVQAEN